MRKCIKTRFRPLQTLKNIFLKVMFLVVWKHVKMHQNTFSTTPDIKNCFLSGGLEACANASKRVLMHLRMLPDHPKHGLKKIFFNVWSG
jgi:hypothetical protein